MKVKTSELNGVVLDWAVAKADGILEPIHNEPEARVVLYSDQWQKYMRLNPRPQVYYSDRYEPSSDPAQAWPIIEREGIQITPGWSAIVHKNIFIDGLECFMQGPTSLIAAMRCYVTSRLGDEVDVPEELLS